MRMIYEPSGITSRVLSADFSAETLQARREWNNIFKMVKVKKKKKKKNPYKQEHSTRQGYHSNLKHK